MLTSGVRRAASPDSLGPRSRAAGKQPGPFPAGGCCLWLEGAFWYPAGGIGTGTQAPSRHEFWGAEGRGYVRLVQLPPRVNEQEMKPAGAFPRLSPHTARSEIPGPPPPRQVRPGLGSLSRNQSGRLGGQRETQPLPHGGREKLPRAGTGGCGRAPRRGDPLHAAVSPLSLGCPVKETCGEAPEEVRAGAPASAGRGPFSAGFLQDLLFQTTTPVWGGCCTNGAQLWKWEGGA